MLSDAVFSGGGDVILDSGFAFHSKGILAMKMYGATVVFLVAGLGMTQMVRGEKDSDLKLALAKAGKAVVQEKFDGPKLPKGWVVNKGDFQVREGTIAGWEKKEDMHAAVLTLQKPFRNAIVRFSFKRDGVSGFNVSFNHPKGHLFRVLINDDGLTINKDKDKNDPNSKPLVLSKAEGKFPPGQWQTMQIEIVGDKVAVQADNGVKVEARHPGLDIEKTGYRFVMRGSTLLLDDVTVWEAQP
jgi:Domain of Unknown Function (DUF1080)